jgi:small conductance mechanosensitive channel
MHQQFPGIFVLPPFNEGRISFGEDKMILRLKFRIWPDRQQPIETSFYQELVAELTKTDPDYKPWMVTISYEVEAQSERPPLSWPWKKKR